MADFIVTTYPDEFTIVDKTDDWVIFANEANEITVELVAVGINDAAIAVAAAAAAEAAVASIGTAVDDAEAAAAAAAISATTATTQAGNAASSAGNAAASEAAAEAAQAAAEAAVASIGTAVDDAEAAAVIATTQAANSATSAGNSNTSAIAAAAAQAAAEAAAALATSVIPTGGTTGQALVKASNADYDYAWASISGVGDMVASIYDPTNVGADAFDRANHHGTQLAATISDFSTAADARVTAAIGVSVQAFSATLGIYAGINPSANVQSILGAANYAAIKALLDLEIGTDVQAFSTVLTTYAGINPSANVQSFLGAADYAAMRTQLNVENGADVTDAANVGSSIHGAAAKTTPVDADTVPLIDSADSNNLKKFSFANLKTWLGTIFGPLIVAQVSKASLVDADAFIIADSAAADVTKKAGFGAIWTSVQAKLNLTAKATPVAADRVYIGDSAASNAVKYSTLTQIMATIFASPALTGTPTAPTAAAGTNTTQIATTAFARGVLTDPLITGSIREDVFVITDAAGFAVDPTNGSIQRITLGASRTPVPANWDDGESVTLFIADGTAFAITWTSFPIVWKNGSAPTLATSGWTEVNITKENGVYRGVHVGDFAS